jgi:flavin reductase (DIM6/NTAB) family NADH-FMN oxidoreductase RutF
MTLDPSLIPYRYTWPPAPLDAQRWRVTGGGRALLRDMPETSDELAGDSRWPAFFPSPICLVTTADGRRVALEKVVGASIVNRFPYVLALSFCARPLSQRHHVRGEFMRVLEAGGAVALQLLPPGPQLDAALGAVLNTPEEATHTRIARTGLPTHRAATNDAPVFDDAYLVYEARLVTPGHDFEGQPIYPQPWLDIGSHRVYFLEVNAIQLRRDIAEQRRQIAWRSLPAWQPRLDVQGPVGARTARPPGTQYQKSYTPHYLFPAPTTAAFEPDEIVGDMALRRLPPLPEDQVEVDNDRARWPCFFPSSAGMITVAGPDGAASLTPCGSTTVLSRHPLVIAPCISYARINVRYAPRAALELIRRRGRFGCGVPYVSDLVIAAITYAGNTSFRDDPEKLAHAGLAVELGDGSPVLPALPVHFDCEVVGEVRLGTHVMFLGEVRQVRVRADVTPQNPLEWCPWATIVDAAT